MAFKSLGQSNSKELLLYGIIGIGFGVILNSVAVLFVQVIAGGLGLLGWICIIWGIIKWNKEKRQKVEVEKPVEEEKPKVEMDAKEMNYCPKCGSKITQESSFCSKCGYKTK